MMQLINAIYTFIGKYLQSVKNRVRSSKIAQLSLFNKDSLITADFLAGFKDFAQKIPDHRLDRNKLYVSERPTTYLLVYLNSLSLCAKAISQT